MPERAAEKALTPESLLDLLKHELDYRRNKQWNIFSWASTMLVAITGGMLTLQLNGAWPTGRRVPVTIAVVVLAAYCFIWLRYNSKKDKEAADKVQDETGLQIRGLPHEKAPLGFRHALVLLAITTLYATWYP
jgi:hypothetical protein